MRLLLSIVLAIMLTTLPSCKFINSKLFGKKTRALAEMKARQDSIRVADSMRLAAEHLLAIENARLDSIRLAEEALKASETKYNIIVGSFLTPEYAKLLSEDYTKMGYKVRILKPANSKFEFVAAEGYNNLAAASKRLAMFQDTVQVESWIYVNR
ncbi:MAG TPA: hypothetical protein VK213_01890 [Bacteroidales bacterium]|nr:hypothetical protein [Bacteroidales bacterium]